MSVELCTQSSFCMCVNVLLEDEKFLNSTHQISHMVHGKIKNGETEIGKHTFLVAEEAIHIQRRNLFSYNFFLPLSSTSHSHILLSLKSPPTGFILVVCPFLQGPFPIS